MKESPFTRTKIRPYLESLGARVIKYHGSAMNEAGVSDLLVCLKGQFIALEIKMEGKKPRPNQIAFIESIIKAGGKAGVVYSDTWREDVERLIHIDRIRGSEYDRCI